MTTPEGAADHPGVPGAPGETDGRVRRPEPERQGANRAKTSAPTGQSTDSSMKPALDSGSAHDPTVSESVAHVVKLAYDVLTQNLEQGRTAAQRFRQGEYRAGEVPGDLEKAALRLIYLARELSTTTFDVCERLLKEVGTRPPGEDRTAGMPPFRAAAPKPAAPQPTAPGPAADAGLVKVTVRFVGGPKAVARTETLARPTRPTAPGAISVTPLVSRVADVAPITGVGFSVDIAVEGLVATVALPDGQKPGVYSGLVHAGEEEIPLGVLTIEIPK